jgi:predicted small integral membrane protein
MDWMAWTLPTALFFGGIAMILIGMTVWELRSPCIERKGFLPISTTRGDRLFIGLLGSAYLHLLVVGTTDWSVWIASALSLLWLFAVMRWG